MVATRGPANCRVAIAEMIGPRTPMHRPKTSTNSASSAADGRYDSASRTSTPVAVPAKLALTTCRKPKRSASNPLSETETTDSIPVKP